MIFNVIDLSIYGSECVLNTSADSVKLFNKTSDENDTEVMMSNYNDKYYLFNLSGDNEGSQFYYNVTIDGVDYKSPVVKDTIYDNSITLDISKGDVKIEKSATNNNLVNVKGYSNDGTYTEKQVSKSANIIITGGSEDEMCSNAQQDYSIVVNGGEITGNVTTKDLQMYYGGNVIVNGGVIHGKVATGCLDNTGYIRNIYIYILKTVQ